MGGSHPHTIAHGWGARLAYDDPADHLGIRVRGIRNGDELEGWSWLMVDRNAEKSIARRNRLVDWLDGLDAEELRPRRRYPANKHIGRPRCRYARHLLDAGEKWQELQTQDQSVREALEAVRQHVQNRPSVFEMPPTRDRSNPNPVRAR